jgi:thiosulfate/3-mercaptopyruvate sulfurtransferase
MSDIEARGYAHPNMLVSTSWVQDHLNDPNVRLIESNEDPLLYPSGHVPGAIEVDWTSDLNDQVVRDYIGKDDFEALCRRIGITHDTILVFYGDKSNWWATYALWVFKLFGHEHLRIMDGGRKKWVDEGRELTREIPKYEASDYSALQDRDDTTNRAMRDQVLVHVQASGQLVDVRSPAEFSGEKLHMEGYPQEGALRGGHIPNAKSVPWSRAANEDGTFKNADALRGIYVDEQGLNPDEPTISYCRIGERSSHTWFVLSYLLGFKNVRNYDGSWTEWGNSVGLPIEK